VKVTGNIPTGLFLNRARERGDSDSGSSQQHQHQSDRQKQGSGYSPDDAAAVTEQQIQAAVEAFGVDEQAAAAGLHVDQIGSGPGLRVILKDVSGNVVRQFSGTEFVRLREVSGGRTLHAPGKILDRKL
jgi:hypothetical protein